ncbi:HutD family protein [Microbacterium sp. cx-59]|uniref:HutD family protein n=1 Tax=Microbacterium sp. cx-59 TaxID=2891207 RepID=UPI001E372380|nr:HutD family protein [Microbacterium sp. cx-59]MCC4908766.1 HutD family protein [Microbacterium sp. cx-59]
MTSLEVRRPFSARAARPWANGAGTTTELVDFGESALLTPESSRWRLSVARLDRAAPFSRLPGHRRMFVPIGGDVVLDIDGRAQEAPEGMVVEFDGGSEVTMSWLSSPCHAVNLMVDDFSARSPSLSSATTELAIDDGVVVVVALSAGPEFGMFDLLTPSHRTEGLEMPGRASVVTFGR